VIRSRIDGAATGAENMAHDLAMLDEITSAESSWVFRTYEWSPWCVSLGKHQPLDVIDHDAVREHGFDVVHRPTGGRAVLHADELTYCVVAPIVDMSTPMFVYERVHQLLLTALQRIGIPDLTFQEVPSDLRKHYASAQEAGAVCFTSSARSEVMAHGKKVIGSAQRIVHGKILQHGSILCGAGHEQVADVIVASDAARERVRTSLREGAITLSDIAGRVVTPQECATSIAAVLADA
jgi:lipoate-protein ligase A